MSLNSSRWTLAFYRCSACSTLADCYDQRRNDFAQKTDLFSITGISMAVVSHNMGQLTIAALLINDIRIFYYLPVLMISGTIAGVAIGVAAELVIRKS